MTERIVNLQFAYFTFVLGNNEVRGVGANSSELITVSACYKRFAFNGQALASW